MNDALENHKGGISIGGRIFINFPFADDKRKKKLMTLKPVWIQRWILSLIDKSNDTQH